jgi:hypothetical protein
MNIDPALGRLTSGQFRRLFPALGRLVWLDTPQQRLPRHQ